MIQSLYTLDFITASGTLRLLSAGEYIEAELAPQVSQGSARYASIGAVWGESQAEGGALVTLGWATARDHASHADLRNYCMRHAAAMPAGKTGTLRITITDGDVWEISDCSILSFAPTPRVPSNGFQTLTTYSATGGRMLPVSEIPIYAGMPWEYINQAWEDVTTLWESI